MITVLFFAAAREAAGSSRLEVPFREGMTAADVWASFLERKPALRALDSSVSFAVNHRFAPRETRLAEGDELAFLPPVSGG